MRMTVLPPFLSFRVRSLRGWVRGRAAGVLLCAALAVLAQGLATVSVVKNMGLSALPLAIALGMALGNFAPLPTAMNAGIVFVKGRCLRLGIVLFGLHITLQEIAALGAGGVALAVTLLTSTFVLTVFVGTRSLGLARPLCMLIGAGSSICGAAAVLAAAPVVQGGAKLVTAQTDQTEQTVQADQITIAVASVVLFGSLSMLIYPALFAHLGLSEQVYGQFAGATIHEVAQVVVAGEAVGMTALRAAVVEKMLRVLLLAPFLLVLSGYLVKTCPAHRCGDKDRIVIPWFALGFVLVAAINSLHLVSAPFVRVLLQGDAALLAMAMAALGLTTRFASLLQAGWRPLLLAAMASGFLMGAGYGLSRWWLM